MGDKAIIQYWPVILTFIAGIMGYATLRADVSYIKAEQERRGDYVYRLPMIENRIVRIEKDIGGIESALNEIKRSSEFISNHSKELSSDIEENFKSLEELKTMLLKEFEYMKEINSRKTK